jgi:hypothetical protein
MLGSKGVFCQILCGATIPRPLPPSIAQAMIKLEITHSDSKRSGFQLVFNAERPKGAGSNEYPLLQSGALAVFNRLKILLTVNSIPQKLMDGVITHIQLNPYDENGCETITITGQDVGVMLDQAEKIVAHPAQNELAIVNKIIALYTRYELIPTVTPPPIMNTPLPTERVPIQHGTDLAYLKQMAKRYGYVFYIDTHTLLVGNMAYWGPPNWRGLKQPVLSVNPGLGCNVNKVLFKYDAQAAVKVEGQLMDSETSRVMDIKVSPNRPQLSVSGGSADQNRIMQLAGVAGLSYQQAKAKAQAMADTSQDNVVVAEGSLNVDSYGHILKARGLVNVRGAGLSHDGTYYVREVTHILQHGKYEQQFCLVRDGIGSTIPLVMP